MWIPEGAALIRGRHLFEARRLLKEIGYIHIICKQMLLKIEHQNRA